VPLSVIILAAGLGKRMRSEVPKVLQPLAGRPMVAHVIERAQELAPDGIHVVYGHGGEHVRAAFADAGFHWWLQSKQLGTGHATSQAMPGVPENHTVLVLCGDVPLIRSASLRRLLDAGAGVAVMTVTLPDPTGYGRIVRRNGKVVAIVEERDATPTQAKITEVNTGLMAVPAARLKRWLGQLHNDNSQGEYYLTDIIAMAFAEGVDVLGVQIDAPDEVLGINDKVQLAEAERAFQRAAAHDLMQKGVTLADPGRLDIRGRVTVGSDVFIDVGVVLSGDVHLGDRTQVGANCVITDSRLGADNIVHPNSVLDGVTTEAGCEIGPFARLRPGAELATKAKVGNFVEIKKSHVGSGSKVNHLSYIGDTTIGTQANVGAGTITCNYDGAAKHRTTIGDGAFIGSGVMLVAPVEVGSGATIGAGSTITKNVPAETLTVARARQADVRGWKRPRKAKPAEE
jgi:bifunctional UDP-N-acetylglucosamine pyrophosphorylase/glucosamine-1-phosphate N-acetyltransferase